MNYLTLALTAMAGLAVLRQEGVGGTPRDDVLLAAAQDTNEHSDWWCAEHGVPEEVCGQCHPKLAAAFKKKGDWCKEHDRPDSQCFICHPAYKAKFAAKYRAKYGKEPPPTADESKKNGK